MTTGHLHGTPLKQQRHISQSSVMPQVMKCLKRALKWAHAAQQQAQAALKASDVEPVSLLVEILNHYAYYFDQGLKTITTNVLQVGCRWHLCDADHAVSETSSSSRYELEVCTWLIH